MAKKVKAAKGTLFAIPRKDGKFVLGQILQEWMPGVICIAVFDFLVNPLVSPDLSKISFPFSLPSVSKSEVTKGHWLVIGCEEALTDVHRAPHYDFESCNFLGASWHSGAMIEKLVNAYYGLDTWEPYPGRIGLLKSLVLSTNH